MSSSHIFMASSAERAGTARPPVSAMPKPMVIGSAAGAAAGAPSISAASMIPSASRQRPMIIAASPSTLSLPLS